MSQDFEPKTGIHFSAILLSRRRRRSSSSRGEPGAGFEAPARLAFIGVHAQLFPPQAMPGQARASAACLPRARFQRHIA